MSGYNNIKLMGRMTKDPEMATTTTGKAVCKFSLAVDRPFLNPETKKNDTDFFNVVFFSKLAEAIGAYCEKGNRIFVDGRLQIRQYKKDEETRYATEVIGERFVFVDTKSKDKVMPKELGREIPDDEKIPF